MIKIIKYRRAFVITVISAGAIGVAFDIAGVVQFVYRNALWADAPTAGSWFFSQGSWWLGVFALGTLLWLALKGWTAERGTRAEGTELPPPDKQTDTA